MTPFSTSFFKLELISLLNTLNPKQKPLWGIMTPQHMVEHLVGSWRISNGRFALPEAVINPERKEFLFTDQPFAKNISNPSLKGNLAELRKPDLKAAVEQLKDEISNFYAFHDSNPGIRFFHPAFGMLNKEEWLLFQTKHIGHHLRQFALLN